MRGFPWGMCGCGGHAWVPGGPAWLPRGHVWLWGACMVAGGGMHACQGGMHGYQGVGIVAEEVHGLWGGMDGCWGEHVWLLGGHGCQGAYVVARRHACVVARGCMVAGGGAWLPGGMRRIR